MYGKKYPLRKCTAFSIFLLLLTAPAITTARTIYVDDDNPADFNNIQTAINNTNDGDTIIVAEGTYRGDGNRDIDFKSKAITLRSENGPDTCVIDCESLGRGFYFHSREDANSVVDGLTIINGYASEGGAIRCDRSGPTISNCVITNNSAQYNGGGMLNDDYSSPTVTNCTFTGNSASIYGGGMVSFSGSPTVKGCTFSDNSANVGGGMGNIGCSPTVTNCTFRGNSAEYGYGGGMCNYGNSPMIKGCTFSGNSAKYGYGGGMCNWERSSPTVTNCILWADVPSEIYVYVYAGQQIVTYSDIQGGWPGEGNIDADPCFADPNNDDYYLLLCSPCINAGDPDYQPEPDETDLDGGPRIIGGRIDMGAYEFVAPRTLYVDDDNPADFNNIQAAINNTNDGDTIIVAEGIYYENINFKGKNITLRSTGPDNPDIVAATIIDGNNVESVATFAGTESETCVLAGFTIQNGAQDGDPYIKGGGGMCGGSETNHTHATIRNNIITHNFAWDGGGLSRCDGLIEKNVVTNNYARWWQGGGGLYLCNGIIRNNIIAANNAKACESAGALSCCDGTIENNTITQNFSYGVGVVAYCRGTIRNCIIWGNTPDGNIDTDPCFADPNNGDYHLKSQAGRWDSNEERWTKDEVTSLCIDAGDPISPIGLEPFPNGGIINMGAYGGTAEASKSYFDKPVCETIVAGDINGDCIVNLKDFALMAFHWLWENKSPAEIPEFYYYVGGGKIYLDLYPELITVCFEEFVKEEEKVALIEADQVLEEIYRELSPFGIVLVSTKIGSNELDVLQTIERLNKLPQIKYGTPVFGYFEHLIGISDEFIAKFYPNITREEIEAFNALNNVEIATKTEWVDWYVLRVKNPKVINALEMANLYYEDPITEYAEPNFWVSMPWP